MFSQMKTQNTNNKLSFIQVHVLSCRTGGSWLSAACARHKKTHDGSVLSRPGVSFIMEDAVVTRIHTRILHQGTLPETQQILDRI